MKQFSDNEFWQALSNLIRMKRIIIDRPKGSQHPNWKDLIYPLDYGYLENTTAADGDGIDVWCGSLPEKTLTGILCSFDKLKNDAEIKLLIGCTEEDINTIIELNKDLPSLYIKKP